MSLETEISERFEKMEQEEINRLEDGHSQRLSEREQQLRRGIRKRLEQQLKLRLKQREARRSRI